MRTTRLLMGMPVTVEVPDGTPAAIVQRVFAYFAGVERRFSPFRTDSEVAAINAGSLAEEAYSAEMREVVALAEETRLDSGGYFDARKPGGTFDPSGVVKGWAIRNAANLLRKAGVHDFFVDAGGDIQPSGRNAAGESWRVGIRNPFNPAEIVKVVRPDGRGVATSGTYTRGQHIYDPRRPGRAPSGVVGLTVIGDDVLEADRFATAAFAMGGRGIEFIEAMPHLEGYQIDTNGRATMTTGFGAFVAS